MSLLHIENLQRPGIEPTSFSLQAGECACLSGPSGSGKTLLLRAIADMDAHEGEMLLSNQSWHSMAAPQWRAQVGLLAAESHWWAATVHEHFTETGADALQTLGFPREAMDWSIDRLSSGERQRLALLRLLQNTPKVLLLDEPTANLDPENGAKVEKLLEDYRKQHRAALLWVSHDQRQIARVANQHFEMRDGRLRHLPVNDD